MSSATKRKQRHTCIAYAATSPMQQGKKKRKSKGNCLEPLEKNQGMTGK